MTLHEKEEKRLWHGGDYTSLPEDTGVGGKHENLQWLEQQNNRHPDGGLAFINSSKTEADLPPLTPQGKK